MANNKYNESIEDKAFKALDEALQIDFGKETVPSRRGSAPEAPEANVSDPSNARNQQAQEEAQRRNRRSATGEQASRAPAFAPANDASRNTPASILKSFDGASSRSAVRTAT
ncbi:hypothetical protein, partial [Rhizobium sp. Pop5]